MRRQGGAAWRARIAALVRADVMASRLSSQHTGGPMSEIIELLPWPAMAASLLAAWLVGSRTAARRFAGFWVFLVSNALWVCRGWQDEAWALIVLNVCLVLTNVRGIAST